MHVLAYVIYNTPALVIQDLHLKALNSSLGFRIQIIMVVVTKTFWSSNSINLSHHLYVDDTLLFSRVILSHLRYLCVILILWSSFSIEGWLG